MATLEFVAFDVNGKEVDWVDPVLDYSQIKPGVWEVDNGFSIYKVRIPEGGYHEVRIRA